MADSLLASLLRGRLLAAVAASSGAALTITETLDDWTLAATAALNLIAALAAIGSKLRDIARGSGD